MISFNTRPYSACTHIDVLFMDSSALEDSSSILLFKNINKKMAALTMNKNIFNLSVLI